MSTPPLPPGTPHTRRYRVANLLHSLSIHVLREARAADSKSGLSPQRLSVLSVLAFVGPQTIGDLATLERVSRPAVSTLVTSLERAGLVERERVAADARSVMVHASPRGRRLMEAARRERLEIVAQRLAALTADELVAVEHALELLE